jgi:hypothetical protein
LFSYRNLGAKRSKRNKTAYQKVKARKVSQVGKKRCGSVSLSEGDLADLKIAKDDGIDAASDTSDFNTGT